jgi:dihydrofolate reductase
MYPAYEEYWLAVVVKNPTGVLPFGGKVPTKNEIAYARLADKTTHIVVSRTLDRVEWKTTRIVRDLEEIRRLKQQPGKNMYVVGGATLVSSMMNASLIDKLRLMVNLVVLATQLMASALIFIPRRGKLNLGRSGFRTSPWAVNVESN